MTVCFIDSFQIDVTCLCEKWLTSTFCFLFLCKETMLALLILPFFIACYCAEEMFTSETSLRLLQSIDAFDVSVSNHSIADSMITLTKTVSVRKEPLIAWFSATLSNALPFLDIIDRGVRVQTIPAYHGFKIHITHGQWGTFYPPGLLIDWNEQADPKAIQSLVNQISLHLSIGTLFSASKLFSSYYYDAEKPCTMFLDELQNQLFSSLSRETVRTLLDYPFFSLCTVVMILLSSRYILSWIKYPYAVPSYGFITNTVCWVSAESSCV